MFEKKKKKSVKFAEWQEPALSPHHPLSLTPDCVCVFCVCFFWYERDRKWLLLNMNLHPKMRNVTEKSTLLSLSLSGPKSPLNKNGKRKRNGWTSSSGHHNQHHHHHKIHWEFLFEGGGGVVIRYTTSCVCVFKVHYAEKAAMIWCDVTPFTTCPNPSSKRSKSVQTPNFNDTKIYYQIKSRRK